MGLQDKIQPKSNNYMILPMRGSVRKPPGFYGLFIPAGGGWGFVLSRLVRIRRTVEIKAIMAP